MANMQVMTHLQHKKCTLLKAVLSQINAFFTSFLHFFPLISHIHWFFFFFKKIKIKKLNKKDSTETFKSYNNDFSFGMKSENTEKVCQKLYEERFNFRSWPLITISPETVVETTGSIETKFSEEECDTCCWIMEHLSDNNVLQWHRTWQRHELLKVKLLITVGEGIITIQKVKKIS